MHLFDFEDCRHGTWEDQNDFHLFNLLWNVDCVPESEPVLMSSAFFAFWKVFFASNTFHIYLYPVIIIAMYAMYDVRPNTIHNRERMRCVQFILWKFLLRWTYGKQLSLNRYLFRTWKNKCLEKYQYRLNCQYISHTIHHSNVVFVSWHPIRFRWAKQISNENAWSSIVLMTFHWRTANGDRGLRLEWVERSNKNNVLLLSLIQLNGESFNDHHIFNEKINCLQTFDDCKAEIIIILF